jgi:hypothetical protein
MKSFKPFRVYFKVCCSTEQKDGGLAWTFLKEIDIGQAICVV